MFLAKFLLRAKIFSKRAIRPSSASNWNQRAARCTGAHVKRAHYSDIVVPSARRPHGCAVRRRTPNNDCSNGVRQLRYALNQTDPRLSVTRSCAARQAASSAGHACRCERRLKWIGSSPYHDFSAEIVDIFRARHISKRPSLRAPASDCASSSVRVLRGKNSQRKN